MKKLILFFLFCNFSLYSQINLSVDQRKIYLNNNLFIIRGICYSVFPIGKNPANYFWWQDRFYVDDLKKIKSLNANTIRVYNTPLSYKINFAEFLDLCYQHGIYVILGYWVNHNQNFSDPSVRKKEKNNFISMINTWKNYPSIIIWCFGNEVYPNNYSNWSDWFSLVKEVLDEAKNIDDKRLYMVAINSEQFYNFLGKSEFGCDDNTLSSLDCWGINLYLGKTFGNFFNDYQNKSLKPLIITEFGCDSWDKTKEVEDEIMQEEYLASQWLDIKDNLTLYDGICSGGCIFEFIDEWWKSKTSYSTDYTQDTYTDWQNFAYSDPSMNEEWFGIMKLSSSTYSSYLNYPKKAFYTIKSLWQQYEEKEEKIFVYSYPNPAKNCEFVKFFIPIDAKKIKIYNTLGELIKIIYVKDYLNTKWYLDDNLGRSVPSGIYIFFVETIDKKYKGKIAVVK